MANPYILGSLSSPMGDSPFDAAIACRDRIITDTVKKRTNATANPAAYAFATAVRTEVYAVTSAVYPGIGDYGPGGGPLV